MGKNEKEEGEIFLELFFKTALPFN